MWPIQHQDLLSAYRHVRGARVERMGAQHGKAMTQLVLVLHPGFLDRKKWGRREVCDLILGM